MEIQLNDYHKKVNAQMQKHGLLARASAFAGGVLSSIQALAGTTKCLPSIPGISAMPWFVPTIETFRKA